MKLNKPKIVERFKQAQDRLVLQAADLSLDTISGMVASKSIDLSPTYQRRERWSAEQQSALIESFLLNIPVPPIYLAEEEFGIYSAIDGKQRISTIHQFMTNKLKLTGLEAFTAIAGCHFKDLPIDLQNALRIRPYVRAITLLKQSSPDLKYEVFTRLNRQGIPLNAQEIRNVLYRGPLNDLVYKLAGAPFLRQQLKIKNLKSQPFREMADAEYVLRFLTLSKHHERFTGSFRRSMDAYMETHSAIKAPAASQLAANFQRAIGACEKIWGAHAFKRASGDGWRDQFLAGMYDAQMLAVARATDAAIAVAISQGPEIVKATRKLFTEDAAFESAVREATNTPSKLAYRVDTLLELIRKKGR